jgi:hypothetical protein
MRKRNLIIFGGLVLICLLGGSCSSSQSTNNRLNSIVKPYLFSVAGWELKAVSQEINQSLFSGHEESNDEVQTVIEYYNSAKQIRALESEIELADTENEADTRGSLEEELYKLQEQNAALKGRVESIIEKQIRETLVKQGIFNPLIELNISFPPVNLKLEQLPCLLVISPRDRIESLREIILKPGLTLEEKANIENRADELDISSLVTEIGGIAMYPPLVDSEASLRTTIDTAIEEWLHQYLAFKPLGFRYVLDLTGLSRNYEIVTMNETLAGMVSKEIGTIVYEKYYSGYEDGDSQESESGSEFNQEMREIRKAVDEYLARREIETAENYMEQKRQYLMSKGYYIRKLNQAYFAFHGAYADDPSSVSPIGLELKELRNQSDSLKEFLNTVATMTSRQDLIDIVRENTNGSEN